MKKKNQKKLKKGKNKLKPKKKVVGFYHKKGSKKARPITAKVTRRKSKEKPKKVKIRKQVKKESPLQRFAIGYGNAVAQAQRLQMQVHDETTAKSKKTETKYYRMESHSNPGKFYDTSINGNRFSCNCMAGQRHILCRHVKDARSGKAEKFRVKEPGEYKEPEGTAKWTGNHFYDGTGHCIKCGIKKEYAEEGHLLCPGYKVT